MSDTTTAQAPAQCRLTELVEQAERHGWVEFFRQPGHVHLERRGRDGRPYLITVAPEGIFAYGDY